MRLYLRFSPHVYKQWLAAFEPTTIIGSVASGYENPIAHFINYETILAQDVPLDGVALYLRTGEPRASLAVRNGLFVTNHTSVSPPSPPEIETGTYPIIVSLPQWTTDLVWQYTRPTLWRPKRRRPEHLSSAERSSVSEENMACHLITASEARDDLEALVTATGSNLTTNEVAAPLALERHYAYQPFTSTIQFEVDLPQGEYQDWVQRHPATVRPLHQALSTPSHPAASSYSSASDALENVIQERVGNTYDVHVYLMDGLPKADVGVPTTELWRPDEWDDFHSKAYGVEHFTFALPDWTKSMFDESHGRPVTPPKT